ncbi:MAG: hypothetical protein ACLSFB_14080 [[Clostridium] scindens]
MIEKRTTKQILVDSVLDLLSKKPIQKNKRSGNSGTLPRQHPFFL